MYNLVFYKLERIIFKSVIINVHTSELTFLNFQKQLDWKKNCTKLFTS